MSGRGGEGRGFLDEQKAGEFFKQTVRLGTNVYIHYDSSATAAASSVCIVYPSIGDGAAAKRWRSHRRAVGISNGDFAPFDGRRYPQVGRDQAIIEWRTTRRD